MQDSTEAKHDAKDADTKTAGATAKPDPYEEVTAKPDPYEEVTEKPDPYEE